MKKELQKAYIALALVSFFWGTTYIAARIGAQNMPGLFVSGIRQFLSGLILVSYFLIRGYRLPGWAIMKKITIQSIFLLCIANGLLTWSVEYISGGLAAIIAALVPLFIALFTVWLSKCARVSKWMVVGLITGFAGILIIFYDYLAQMQDRAFLLGVVLAVVSTLSWSFGTVYSSKQKPPIDVLFNVGLQMLIAGIMVLIACAITGKYVSLASIQQDSWLVLLYLIVFGSLVAYTAYVFVITKLPPTQVSVYAYINPIVAVLLGWLLLSEKMNVHMILGTIVTLGGIYLVNRETKKVKL